MKFICNKCNKTKDIYKVMFTLVDNTLVCKDAICCNEYMNQVKTKEYEGIPDIKRNAPKHSHTESKKYVDRLMKGNNKREL